MPFSILYDKVVYTDKISELEGYYSQLQGHLSTLEGYKEQMYQFWEDDKARTTGEALASMIRQVKNSMDSTQNMLNFYKRTVEKFDGTEKAIDESLQDVFGILGKFN